MSNVDFGRTAGDYARHRAGFPESFFARLRESGIGTPGQRVLDLGTGTGTVARGLALGGATVVGLDPSAAMTEQARALDAAAGVSVRYVEGRAEDTGLADGSFDLVAAGQCWHWFDRPRAAAEVRRLLVAGGRLVICHFDWIPVAGNVVEATERLIRKHNPAWKMGGGDGVYGPWLLDVAEAGFRDIETHSYDVDAIYSHEAWRGRIRASAGVAASLPPEQVEIFDAELRELLDERFPEDPLGAFHRVWWMIASKPV